MKKSLLLFTGIYIIVLLALLMAALMEKNNKFTTQNRAETPSSILNTTAVSLFSNIQQSGNVQTVDLFVEPYNRDTHPLYTTRSRDGNAIYELMQENPGDILPAGFEKNSVLLRQKSDDSMSHFYYAQKIDDIAVFGSSVRFDISSGNRIFGIDGTFITSQNSTQESISLATATQTALLVGEKTAQEPVAICPDREPKRLIVNKKFLGISDDDANIITLSVPVCSSSELKSFDTDYFVSLNNGEVVLEQNNIIEVLNRSIYNCAGGSCRKSRSEGGGAVGDADVDRSYDILGEVYNYYFNTHKRDSFNNRGAQILARVKVPSIDGLRCPNAAWMGTEMQACSGMVARDVWAHEMTHAVVQYSAGFIRGNQSGALNEGFADVFGYALDPDDWTMGEDTRVGIIRDFANPGRGGQPDRMFSPKFYCGTGDDGGVHLNSTVLTHGLYLAINGGSFNGCNIRGLPKEKVLPVMYKALTTYLSPTANFGNAYSAIVKACADLYNTGSSECRAITAAFSAVEMDQQPTGVQRGGIKCTSPNARKPPTCVGGSNNFPSPTPRLGWCGEACTGTPGVDGSCKPPLECRTYRCPDGEYCTQVLRCQAPSGRLELCPTTITPTSKPSPSPFGTAVPFPTTIPTPYPTEFIPSSTAAPTYWPTNTPYPEATYFPTSTPRSTPTQIPTRAPTQEPIETPRPGEIMLSLLLKFQGINSFRSGTMPVRVGLVSDDQTAPIYKNVQFSSEATGNWVGRVSFSTPVGRYCLYIKGSHHMQRKICDRTPTETYPGSYRQSQPSIDLATGQNILNFSGITQLAGDLPEQDGVANSYDTILCRRSLLSTDSRVVRACDVNYDGVCNAVDCSLIYSTLAFKFDDE